MRTVTFILFFGVFFAITGSISLYIFVRGLQSIPADSSLRHAYSVVFWTVALSYIGGRILERALPSFLADFLIWMGSFWMAAMLYFLIAVVSLDLLRLVNRFIPFFPSAVTGNYAQVKYITLAAVTGLVGLLLLGGHVNSTLPRVRELSLSIPKKASGMKSLDIALVSDIHMGTIVGRSRTDQIVEKINSLDPDLVLLPGDIVDEDLAPVVKQNLGESLRKLRTRLGVYAVTGNHEYIGGVEEACSYLIEHNVTVLRDQSVKVGDSVYIVGREDRSMNRFDGGQRKSLEELMAAVDRNCPVILMDHQPFGLDEAASQGIDLQVSGHTHAGQLWPLNHIVDPIYELPWGYKKTAGRHFYVSNGAGTWGPPVRLGNRPEIVRIRLNFQ